MGRRVRAEPDGGDLAGARVEVAERAVPLARVPDATVDRRGDVRLVLKGADPASCADAVLAALRALPA